MPGAVGKLRAMVGMLPGPCADRVPGQETHGAVGCPDPPCAHCPAGWGPVGWTQGRGRPPGAVDSADSARHSVRRSPTAAEVRETLALATVTSQLWAGGGGRGGTCLL